MTDQIRYRTDLTLRVIYRGDEPIGRTHEADDAALIVNALNGRAAARERIDELEDAVEAAVLSDVFAERDEAREQVQVLQDRIAKAAQILRDCAHDSDGMCGYGQKALAALDGEDGTE